jgi:hypothetical protein
MEGFKKLPKGIQAFKEGGSVYQSRKSMKEQESADIAQDKVLVKKGVKQHEAALHKGEPKTELKLKAGGRAKKDCGTVKKYKTGGSVSNVYEAKKSAGDKDNIKKTKEIKASKAAAPSGAKETVQKFANGKSVKMTPEQKMAALMQQRDIEKMARAKKYLGAGQQSQLINQSPAAAGLSAPAPSGTPAAPIGGPAPAPGINAGAGAPAGGAQNPAVPGGMKKGGKAKKACK